MDSFFGLDRVSPHDEALELLTTVYDTPSRIIVESILRGAEIPYLLKERGSGTAVKVIAGFSMLGTDIFVLREHLEVALELITPSEEIVEIEADEEEED